VRASASLLCASMPRTAPGRAPSVEQVRSMRATHEYRYATLSTPWVPSLADAFDDSSTRISMCASVAGS